MEKDVVEKLILHFSISSNNLTKNENSKDHSSKISGFIDLINNNFKKLFHPSETMVSTLNQYDGVSLNKDKSDYKLSECLLTEST